MNTSATDYLIEFINTGEKDWIKSVVSCYLTSNEEISETDINLLKEELLSGENREFDISDVQKNTFNTDLIKLKNLHHKSGVNALADNQRIKFNDQVTILYGLNGSGKSSYFRILQALMGNMEYSEIIPNIYLEEPNPPSVSLTYEMNSIPKNASWNSIKQFEDLKNIKIFDSKYSKKFLEKRESDDQVLYPYKLYVFSEISEYIDKIKNLAMQSLDQRSRDNILPDIGKFSEDDKEIFKRETTQEDLDYFNKIASSYKEKELQNIRDEIKSVTKINYSDRLADIMKRIQRFENSKKLVESVLFEWINKSNEYKEELINYQKLLKEFNDRKNQIDILSNLPGTESNEWKEFIKLGLSISEKTKNLDNECPYCHREFDERTLEIVKSYSIFIKDEASKNLKNSEIRIDKIINKAIDTCIDKEDYIFEEDNILSNNISLLIDEVIGYINLIKNEKNPYTIVNPIKYDIKSVTNSLEKIEKTYRDKKDEYIKKSYEKEEYIKRLKNKEDELIAQESIYNQIDIINKYIKEKIEIRKLINKVSKISSKKISSISKKAHRDILSKNLVNKFELYLNSFGINNREIELKTNNTKGIQQTELIMRSKSNITNILSEGEQKSVSIALFLAEISISNNKSTIILDDPVNSLDHRMIENLTKIILSLDNQIIIFTHNRMFLDSFYGSNYGHVCKNLNNGCNSKGKHVFAYKVNSEGLNEKGVITQLRNTAKNQLDEVEKLLNKSPFEDELNVSARLRRIIDSIIDEVVFNGQIPRKYSMKGSGQSINWNELKDMAKDPDIIDGLKEKFDRLSSGQLHEGQTAKNNPLEKEELKEIYEYLKVISDTKN